ncbi:hypothetical protein CYMTET_39230 [Cymbomonas tetramitiformis]|uniref:Uncharacterized protein n=1 Tax=Cymbomonas tetramitiformis TaxID=36881 RepID=A0AAE0CCJ7_9CHLO|nr:hypothetical protein CYMTET_39230 [Cymbomonas tetramitiformis]
MGVEEEAKEYLQTVAEPVLHSLLRDLAVDRPRDVREYTIRHFQQQAWKELDLKSAAGGTLHASTKDPADLVNSEYEADTAIDEEMDLDQLLLPGGKLPGSSRFSLCYNGFALRGWARQTSPACAAASVAGAWNALLEDGNGRASPAALQQQDVVDVLLAILEEQISKRRERLERLLGGPLDEIVAAVVAELGSRGRSLGGKGEAGAKPSEYMAILRDVATKQAEAQPVSEDAQEGAAHALHAWFSAEAPAEAAAAEGDEMEGNTEESGEAADSGKAESSAKGFDWRKEMKEYLGKLGGLEKLTRPLPSTGEFGSWGILQAVARLSAASTVDEFEETCSHQQKPGSHRMMISTRPGRAGLQARVVAGKKVKGRTGLALTLSAKDSVDAVDEQWMRLKGLLCREDTVLIFHLRNHYAIIFAAREWNPDISEGAQNEVEGSRDAKQAPDPVREILTARRGQRPSAWIAWTEVRELMLKWTGHAVIAVQRI